MNRGPAAPPVSSLIATPSEIQPPSFGALRTSSFGGLTGPWVNISGADLTEGGAAVSYSIVLNTKPASNVTVTLNPSSELSYSQTTFVFTPASWNMPQTLNVSAVDNAVVDNYHSFTISASVTSDDPEYAGLGTVYATVVVVDDDGPSAVPDSASAQGEPVTFSVLSNDVEPHGYALAITSFTQGAGGGTVVKNADNTFTYTPPTDLSGTDLFTYTIDNGHQQSTTGHVLVNVSPVSAPPVLTPVANQTVSEDSAVSLQLQATSPTHNTVWFSATNLPSGLMLDEGTGLISGQVSSTAARSPNPYIPPTGSYTYSTVVTATDSDGLTAMSRFTWTVTHVNHEP